MSSSTVSLEKKKIKLEEHTEVSILGTSYKLRFVKLESDEYLKENDLSGYCDFLEKEIVIALSFSIPGRESLSISAHLDSEQKTLRHEIVHAFLMESGLDADSLSPSAPWARNEEMVDWFAIQGPKVVKAWKEVDAL